MEVVLLDVDVNYPDSNPESLDRSHLFKNLGQ